MICCLREELTGVSARLDITSLAILDSDGRELDDGEALERQDDPDLIFCAVRSTLLEVSLCLSPTDPRARARAIGLTAEAWRAIKHGERELARILRPDRADAGGDFYQRILADKGQVHFGAPEPLQVRHDDDDDDRGFVMPDRRLIRYGAAEPFA
jgi:hypothetical protein